MVAVGNNWLRTFVVCHHLGRNYELALGKWEIIRGGGSWRLPWACSCPGPTARERRFGNSWRSGTSPWAVAAPLAVGFWVGMVQVIPEPAVPQPLPIAPGHWDPLKTPAGLSLCFPILLSGITRLDPGTPDSSSWAQSGLWDSPLGTAPGPGHEGLSLALCWECSSWAGSGSPAAPWDVSVPIPFQDPVQDPRKPHPWEYPEQGLEQGGKYTTMSMGSLK